MTRIAATTDAAAADADAIAGGVVPRDEAAERRGGHAEVRGCGAELRGRDAELWVVHASGRGC